MSYRIDYKRVYQNADPKDGSRVLVDRLWPRGKRREDLALTEWYRDAAPTPTLRRAWHKGEIDRDDFAKRYRQQLHDNVDCLTPLLRWSRQGPLTLLTASRDPDNSHLPILRDTVLQQLAREDSEADGNQPSSPTCYDE